MKTLIYQGKQIELSYSTTINHLIPHQLWQCGLSLPALGLASYLYTLPKQWRLSVTHLSKQMAMSKNTCRKYLKEIFSNEKAREVFKVKEVEINTYDFEEGLTAYDYASDKEELENFTSSVAKDVSEPNKKRVMIIQTQRQRYLLNLCFKGMDCHASTSALARNDGGKLSSRADEVGVAIHKKVDSKNAQNLSTINKNLLQDSYKDSSSKRTREKTNTLEAQKFTTSFSSSRDGFCDDFTRCADSSAEIRLGCLSHKRESSSRKRAQKTSDLTSEQLRYFNPNEQEAIKLWIHYKQESTRKPLKPSQIDFQLRKITRFKEQGEDICGVIEKSLDMGWQGLFPVIEKVDCHALPCKARNDREKHLFIQPKMPKNLGGKAVLRVENV